MSAPILGILAVLAAAPAPASAGSARGYWIEAVPQGPEEEALRQALARDAFGGPTAAVAGLSRVSASYPGTAASGLAQMAAGLAVLE